MTLSFGSDNHAGIHPEVLAALGAANGGRALAYGDDPWTARLEDVMRGHLGSGARTFPVLTGTGANVVGLSAAVPRWGAVVCARTAHVMCDEGGAPEQVAGLKMLTVETPDGRLTPELAARETWGFDDVHRARPSVLSLTQSTELGTVYAPEQIGALAEHAHAHGMLLHVDGARIANAAASLDLPLRALTSDVGVDLLSLGGTKNGALAAEAIVVLDAATERGAALAAGIARQRMSGMQLASKSRFVAAQLLALFEGDLWLANARHANVMAARLRAGIDRGVAQGRLPGVMVAHPTEANGVFVALPPGVAQALRGRVTFHVWDAARGVVRWMCGFDTTAGEVDALLGELESAVAGTSPREGATGRA